MDPQPSEVKLLRFGIFEVDLKAGEVRKGGVKQKLAAQPFQVLQALLERPKEVVTREELRQRLWPGNTFVDYDLALKKAVNRVREVLGDSAESPRFIETIPRRGYRLLADVEAVESSLARSAVKKQNRWRLATAVAVAAGAALLLGLNAAKLRTRIFAKSRSLEIRSIAVLPLQNLSNDPGQDYFSDGMTDALTTELAQIGSLRVISRTSAMHFKGTRQTLPQIGRELNVDAVVEGSAVRAGDRIRITAQLIETQTDRHLWAKSYERNAQDVLALQDEVARDIANKIKTRLTPKEQASLWSSGPVDPEALQSYLKGRFYWNMRTEEGIHKGIEYFRQAIAIDSHYAVAYVGLADSYVTLAGYRIVPPKEALPLAKEAALKALEIDAGLAEAHTPLAVVRAEYDLDLTAAEKEYKRSIELNPNYATAHQWYAEDIFAPMGRSEEAIAEMKRAQQLDPLSLPINFSFGYILYLAREDDQAMAQLQKTLEMYKSLPVAHSYLGRVYVQKKMFAEAIEEFQSAATLSGSHPFYRAWLGYGYAVSGRRREALEILNQLTQPSTGQYVSPYDVAAICAGLGRKDQAIKWLQRAYEERSPYFHDLNVEPVFDPLHSDPRFVDLVRRIGWRL